MMHMSFWFSSKIDNFLIKGFNITSVGALVGLCIGMAFLSFAFEWIRLCQAKHRQTELVIRSKQLRKICPLVEETSLLHNNPKMNTPLDLSLKHRVQLRAWDAGLWLMMHNLGYLLMLTVMIYNFWVFLSVILGGGVGYFIFGQSFMKLNMENHQVTRETFCMNTCAKPDEPAEGESTPVMQGSSSRSLCHQHEVHEACHQQEVQATVHEATISNVD